MRWLRSVYDVIVDRSPAELFGAIGVALGLSIAISGLFLLLRAKVKDQFLLVVVLLLIATVGSMGLGAGYVASIDRKGPFIVAPPRVPGPGGGPGAGLASRILEFADADGDGGLSSEEASRAAGRFVEEATGGQEGRIERDALAAAISRRLPPPRPVAGLPPALPPDEAR